VASRITRHLAPRWKSDFGLTVTSWRVMAVIGRYEPLSAMEVAERTSTDAFFVGRAIDKLVEQGYLKKGVDPEDRRRLRQVEDMINLVEADLLAGIPADDLSTFFATMSLLESRAGRLGACDP
jgi:DNA-binding MarR family transcriptional regulator